MVQGHHIGQPSRTATNMSNPPTETRVKVSNRGRTGAPVANDNSDESDIPEFELFGAVGPRGLPPLTEFLDVWDVDMMRKPDDTNKVLHHTALYQSDFLIVRRGQEFQLKITFNRPYDASKDKFAVEFVIGASPQYSKNTYIPVFPTDERQTSWQGRIIQTSNNILTMGIVPAATCIVGKYHMYVAVVTPYGIRRTKRDKSRDIYVLFNPWAAADAVFLDDDAEREECVLTETGIIYHGAHDDISEKNWNYGQFNFGILDACLYILDRSEMPISNRGDAIKVVRKASAMMNSYDDNGVLVGNWSGDYTYGVAPTAWTGSTEILLSYASSKTPICYAQCWVFAAVLNSFLRCLGIPSRVITNFVSAHDNDGNLKTDVILDENGRIDRSRTRDSIWNYHCWNECYMSRPDLPAGFGGWQVVDATPQETSDGFYRCGPASVHAIKHGFICYPFDAPFIFAEVNSDMVFYSRRRDGSLETVQVKRSHIGRLVLTKAAGTLSRRDITEQYKFPEGSAEERTVLEKAELYSCIRETSNPPTADVDLLLSNMEVSLGDDFQLTLKFVNRSNHRRTVEAYVSGSVVYYTGVTSSEFLFTTPTIKIGPGKTVTETVKVEAKKYMKLLVEQSNLHFIVTGKVTETGHIVTGMKVVRLHNPKLSVKVSGPAKVNEEMMAMVEFTNPFTTNLEDVTIRMEGSGIMLPKSKFYSLITGGSSLTWSEFFTPQRAGTSQLIVTLDCPGLRQVYGEAAVTVNA
uniref:coagulation factor XIII A chain isoform X3 n=1 Tax=Doryrhamphus excisus TaxID=161450 RepID=UPI0025AE4E74|nr:coagulation factor XIII A chain isoform X3 [Doryrhamphus excisus]